MALLSNRLSTVLLTTAFVSGLAACTAGKISDGKWEPGAAPASSPAGDDGLTAADRAAGWKKANLTNFESYPAPDSEECRQYNGCTWAGQFAFVDGKKSKNWVKAHNIVAVHEDDADRYALHKLRLKKGGDTIDVTVYDECADSDCDGCCTENANQHGIGFLIDIEKYTMQRFGHGDGIVQWQCLDCN